MALRQLVNYREDFGAKAPITEALIDVQVTPSADLSLDALRRFNEPLAAEYPHVRTQTEWAGQLRVEVAGTASTMTSRHGVRGFVFLDEEQRLVVQVRRDGFTFSRLEPYQSWDALRAAAKTAWARYVEVARPTAVRRVALRYINRLNLPGGELQLPDWFRLHPNAPPGLGTMSDVLVRLALRHPDEPDIVALTTLGTAPSVIAGEAGFLLDIDVWLVREMQVNAAILDILEDLHEYKNDVFFGSLTEQTFQRIRQ